MRPVAWSHRSRRDLEAIEAYWTDKQPNYVADVLEAAHAATRSLVEHPGLGPQVEGTAFRKCRVGLTPYLLLYVHDEQVVRVVRVRHEREDWKPRR